MKRVLKDISSLVPNEPQYSDIQTKLSLGDFQSEALTVTPRRNAFKIAIPIIAVCSLSITVAILVPLLLNNNNKTSSKLVELNNPALLKSVSELSNSSNQDLIPTPSLDKVYEDYIEYINNGTIEVPFFYETKLKSNPEYTCYYLSKDTISKIDDFSSKEYIHYMYDEGGHINYLRYYKELLDEEKLTDLDKVMVYNAKVENPLIEKEIDGYQLVKIVRTIDIENKAFGDMFIENVRYKEEEKSVSPLTNSFSISMKYDNYNIIFNNVPYMKSLFKEGIYSSGFLDIFSYQINEENNTFKTGISYDCSILENNEHYYDQINSIIIEKTFVTKKVTVTADNVEKSYDCYYVVCDYNKTKTLFDF